MSLQTKVSGVILAGGLARRMQHQDKGLLTLNDKALVSYAIDAMSAAADFPVINANRNLELYQKFALPVISDLTDSFDGPLAGVLTALAYASAVNSAELLVMPCDSPLFQAVHLQKLLILKRDHQADIAVAFDGSNVHPVFLALNVNLKADLEDYLAEGGRKVETWLNRHHTVPADFSATPEIFSNINTLDELFAMSNIIIPGVNL